MPVDVTTPRKTSSNRSSEKAISAEAPAAVRALAEILKNSKGHGGCRRYVLERIDGELVFCQTEFDAAFEAAIAEVFGLSREAVGRRTIKLPR